MSKQIKKKEIDKREKQSRVMAIVSMISMFALVGVLIGVLPSLMDDENPVKACIVAGVYGLFTVSCILLGIFALLWYKKNQSMTGLFQGLICVISSFMSLLNIRFVLVMVMSAFEKDSLAEKLMGDVTSTQFVANQSSNWTCLVIAMVMSLVLGVLGIIKLASK